MIKNLTFANLIGGWVLGVAAFVLFLLVFPPNVGSSAQSGLPYGQTINLVEMSYSPKLNAHSHFFHNASEITNLIAAELAQLNEREPTAARPANAGDDAANWFAALAPYHRDWVCSYYRDYRSLGGGTRKGRFVRTSVIVGLTPDDLLTQQTNWGSSGGFLSNLQCQNSGGQIMTIRNGAIVE